MPSPNSKKKSGKKSGKKTTGKKAGRSEKGKFLPGESGNPDGRPPVLTAAIIKSLENSLSIGLDVRSACLVAGIGRKTFYRYMEISEDDAAQDPEAALFRHTIEKARATGEAKLAARVATAKSWRAPLEVLARRFPGWSSKSQVTHEGNPEKPVFLARRREPDPTPERERELAAKKAALLED